MKHLIAMKKLNSLSQILLAILLTGFLSACASSSYKPGQRETLSVASDIQHSEFRFRSADNLSLFAQSWRPAGDIKASVILVHGLKDHSDRYNDFATMLARNGIAVYAYDLRGHGDSEGDREWVKPFDQYLEDLDLFYKKVHADLPGRPIFLFGHSMGGAIVTLYTLDKKPDVKGLILSAPALKPGAEINKMLIAATTILATVAPTLAVMKLDPKFFSRDPKTQEAMERDPLITKGKGPARTAKELLNALARIQENQSQLSVSFLALHGTEDKLTNPEGSKELHEKAASKDKTVNIYPGIYHDLLHEPEKEKISLDILEWLKARI